MKIGLKSDQKIELEARDIEMTILNIQSRSKV